VREEATFARVREALSQFEVFETGGVELAVAAARNFRTLRQRGLTVRKTIGCLIATFCLRERHLLLHRDRDYDAFEEELGLRVVRPYIAGPRQEIRRQGPLGSERSR
jgi:predicted nucleic acid-binding protein